MRKTERKKTMKNIAWRERLLPGIAAVYLFAMMTLFPLYYYDHYLGMAFFKWGFFMITTLALAALLFAGGMILKAFSLIGRLQSGRREKKEQGAGNPKEKSFLWKLGKRKPFSVDGFAAAWLICSVACYALCPDKRAGWIGVDGWYMGIVTQAALLFVYAVFSGIRLKDRWIYGFCCTGCTVTAVIAILQRTGKDILHLYYGMEAEVIRDYLSTVGNRTWFSGYFCAVFPIALYPFLRSEDKRVRLASGAFWALSVTCLLMTYSDSAIVALAVLLFVLGVTSLRGEREIRRYLELLLVMAGAWSVMTLVYHQFFERMREARGLSRLLLESRVSLPLFLLVSAVYGGFIHRERAGRFQFDGGRLQKWRRVLWIGALAAAVLFVLFISLNTAGVFESWFGFTLRGGYLFFDDGWGDGRGFSWKLTLRMYRELPLERKLFGVGPDCFAWYAYSHEPYVSMLRAVWGGAVLTNAHNEWLNSLMCSGLVGFISYLGLFVSVTRQYILSLDRGGGDSLAQGIGLCVIVYVAHNFFCYQQISAAAPVFILMGIAANRFRG